MDRHLRDLETALRVLTAVIERREPDPGDVRQLHGFVPFETHLPPDELACEYIQRTIMPADSQTLLF